MPSPPKHSIASVPSITISSYLQPNQTKSNQNPAPKNKNISEKTTESRLITPNNASGQLLARTGQVGPQPHEMREDTPRHRRTLLPKTGSHRFQSRTSKFMRLEINLEKKLFYMWANAANQTSKGTVPAHCSIANHGVDFALGGSACCSCLYRLLRNGIVCWLV